MRNQDPIAWQTFSETIEGARLPGSTLQAIVTSEKIVILHFLRHLGCAFCKHAVDELYKLKQSMPNMFTIYFVHQSSTAAGETFFDKHYPQARHISDPKLKLFKLFGIRRKPGISLFSPAMVARMAKLVLLGYTNERGYGDVHLLSGTFLFNNGQLVWQHLARFAGDEPNWKKLNTLK